MRRYIWAFIWGLIAVTLIVLANCVPIPSPSVAMSFKEACIDRDQVYAALESNEGVRYALWCNIDGEAAVYCGDWRLLTGDSLVSGNSAGTLVSSRLALETYGDENVAGREIEICGETRIIGGVYKSGVVDALIEYGAGGLNGGNDAKYDNMALAFDSLSTYAWAGEAKRLIETLGAALPFDTTDTALLASLYDTSAPRSLVPTLWSDMDGWRSSINELFSRLGEFISSKHAPLQSDCLSYAVKRALLYLAAVIASLHAAKRCF